MSMISAEPARHSSATASPPIAFEEMQTLGDIPRYHARHRPSQGALYCEGHETDWRTLNDHASQVSNALTASGAGPGDRVAFIGRASDAFFELLFGAAKAGIVLVPIQWRLAPAEIRQILTDCAPRLLFFGSDMASLKLDELCDGSMLPVIVMGDSDSACISYEQWRISAAEQDPAFAVHPSAVALQLYTSGTTGEPKGVMLSHANILEGRRLGMLAGMPWNAWAPSDVSLVSMPIGHVGGVAWGIVALFNGALTVIHAEFSPARALEAIEHHGVSKVFFVPAALQMLLLEPRVRAIDYSRLRYILYGASPIALDLLREATEVFGCGFVQQYGMTETCGTIVYLPPEDHDAAGTPRMRSAGLPMPGVELRIVHPDTRVPVAAGEVGEVETRSVANMVGYWNRPEATMATVCADGWLRTGDAGYIDDDGYLYIHDRFKDMICSGAENVYPAEVENAVYGHPAVQDVAVFGVPDERWGEAVKAAVVLRPGASADAAGIIAFTKARIAGFKAPKTIDFVDTLPRGPTGKILRRALREPYWAGRSRQVN